MKRFVKTSAAGLVYPIIGVMITAVLACYTPAWSQTDRQAEAQEWYDPSDWFDSDDEVEHQEDWFGYTFGYSGPESFYERNKVLGYYEEDEGVERPGDASGVMQFDYDYYTKEWWNEEGGLENRGE